MLNTVTTKFIGDVTAQDRAIAKVTRDIRRYEQDRAKGEQEITTLVTRQAEQQYRAKVTAQRRATQDILAELKKQRQAETDGLSSFLTGRGGAGLAGGAVGGPIALAGATIAATAVAVTALTGAVVDLTRESVRLAGNFELTRNAMTVFTGSSRAAREELKQLSDLSRRTPGLGLEDAEKGAVRLRALGFSAGQTQKLLEGLAKQKILSGVGNEALDRVTLNLGQIATGSGDLQDIKDLVTNLPTIRKEIVALFGTLEGFQQAVKTDAAGALDRLIDRLATVQAPVAGLNDAIQKLEDSFIKAGRAFGEPILEPLTAGVKSLTNLIEENTGTLTQYGQNIADTYRGAAFYVQVLADAINSLPKLPGGGNLAVQGGKAALFGPLYPAVTTFDALRDQVTATGRGLRQSQQTTVGAGALGDISGLLKQQEKADKDALESLKRSYDQRQSITENYYKIEEAKVAVSGKSEIEQIKAIAAIKRQAIQQQLREESENYSKVLTLAKDREDIEKAGAESFRTRNKLETELRLSALEAERKINDERKKQAEERKREAEKAQKEAEQLRKSVTTLFDDVAGRAGTYNPYLKYLKDAEIFTRNLKEVTKGLTEEQRNYLIATEAATAARQRSELRGASIVEAFGLRAEARDFRRGYLLEGQAAIDQRNRDLQEQFSQLSRGKLTQEAYDKIVIDLTRGINPRELDNYNRFEAAQVRERQAERIANQEKHADDFFTALNRQIEAGGLKVKLVDGEQIVRIVNEAPERAKVSTQPSKADSAALFGR